MGKINVLNFRHPYRFIVAKQLCFHQFFKCVISFLLTCSKVLSYFSSSFSFLHSSPICYLFTVCFPLISPLFLFWWLYLILPLLRGGFLYAVREKPWSICPSLTHSHSHTHTHVWTRSNPLSAKLAAAPPPLLLSNRILAFFFPYSAPCTEINVLLH